MIPLIRLGLAFTDASAILRLYEITAGAAGIAKILTEPQPGLHLEGDVTHLYKGLSTADPAQPYRIDRPELTCDMAENIVRYFEPMQRLGRLMIESNALGLWFVGPTNRRLFIGLARLPDRPVRTEIVPTATTTTARAACKLN